jgi:hypothetical protein
VLRGDEIDPSETVGNVLDIPLHRATWEPDYLLPEYSDDGIQAPSPSDRWTHEWLSIAASNDTISPDDEERVLVEIDDDDTEEALRALVEPWTTASHGRARCVVVEGGLAALVAALGRSSVRVASLSPQRALQWLAWCGSSGGSHGRRRGSASGRFGTWWILAALAGVTDSWDELIADDRLPDELQRTAERLRWYRVDLDERHSFELSLAAVDEDEHLTFGLFAHDDPT